MLAAVTVRLSAGLDSIVNVEIGRSSQVSSTFRIFRTYQIRYTEPNPVQRRLCAPFPRSIAPLILALAFPVAALADNNQTSVLQNNTSINFDTGNLNAAANDVLWNGTNLALQGNATAVRLYPDFPEEQYAFITSIQIQLTPGTPGSPSSPPSATSSACTPTATTGSGCS